MPWEAGLKDTVLVLPGERVEVAVRFAEYPGLEPLLDIVDDTFHKPGNSFHSTPPGDRPDTSAQLRKMHARVLYHDTEIYHNSVPL